MNTSHHLSRSWVNIIFYVADQFSDMQKWPNNVEYAYVNKNNDLNTVYKLSPVAVGSDAERRHGNAQQQTKKYKADAVSWSEGSFLLNFES